MTDTRAYLNQEHLLGHSFSRLADNLALLLGVLGSYPSQEEDGRDLIVSSMQVPDSRHLVHHAMTQVEIELRYRATTPAASSGLSCGVYERQLKSLEGSPSNLHTLDGSL